MLGSDYMLARIRVMPKEVHIGYGGLKVSINDNVRIPCMSVVPLLKTGVVVKECPVWWEEEVLF